MATTKQDTRPLAAPLLALLLVPFLGAPGAAQAPEPAAVITAPAVPAASAASSFPARAYVEILDAKGRPAADLASADVTIREGAAAISASRLTPLDRLPKPAPAAEDTDGEGEDAAGPRVVVYFDQALLSPATVRGAAESLQGASRELAALGEVELVSAGVEGPPESLVRTANALIVGERLSRMAISERGLRGIQAIREATLEELANGARATPPLSVEERRSRLAQGIAEELELVGARLDLLAATLLEAELPHARPMVAIWVLDGFDLDPLSFYAGRAESADWQGLAADRRLQDLRQRVRSTAETLGAMGWTLWLLPPTAAKETKAAEFTSVLADDGQGGQTALPGVTLRPGKLFGRDREAKEAAAAEAAASTAELNAPREPLELLAAETGGEILDGDRSIRDAAERFGRRFAVDYPSTLQAADGAAPWAVTVARQGYRVRAARYRAVAAPPAAAGLRLARVLQGEAEEGGLAVAAALRPGSADGKGFLETRADLRDIQEELAGRRTTLRVTVDALLPAGRRQVAQDILPGLDLGATAEWVDRRELELPAEATELVVLVEDLDGGRWGGVRANVLTSAAEAEAEDVLPPPRTIELQRPEEAVLRGRVKFEAQVLDPGVKSVVFSLDDREIAEVKAAPWVARVDLGRTPRRQSLGVVAYDAKGLPIGRDTITINGGESGFGVKITEPTSSKGTGLVPVAAEVSVPSDRKLERVLFFWNTELLATLFQPPFRHAVQVPSAQPVGYVRVVALLDDGSLSEDVLFLNGPQGDRVDVQLVELFTVVTDENGRPVRGLGANDFVIREDGRDQQIASFSDAEQVPLTLGLAIDSSASMFVKLPQVQKAAVDFLRATFTEQDRALLIDFDDSPRLARGATSNLERMTSSIQSLEASGRTALWEAIVFSLVQLQGIQGRKALIVFSDGADEDEQFPFRSSLRIAKELGVPIYLILMRKEPQESATLGLLTRSFSSRAVRLAEATGGRVFYAKDYKNLGAVYDEIDAELRSQYLLTYYPKSNAERGWRDVEVVVKRPGLRARSLTGYLP